MRMIVGLGLLLIVSTVRRRQSGNSAALGFRRRAVAIRRMPREMVNVAKAIAGVCPADCSAKIVEAALAGL